MTGTGIIKKDWRPRVVRLKDQPPPVDDPCPTRHTQHAALVTMLHKLLSVDIDLQASDSGLELVAEKNKLETGWLEPAYLASARVQGMRESIGFLAEMACKRAEALYPPATQGGRANQIFQGDNGPEVSEWIKQISQMVDEARQLHEGVVEIIREGLRKDTPMDETVNDQ